MIKMKKRRRKTSYYIKQAAVYAVIILLALVCVIPLYWMVRSSFMKNTDIYSMRPFVFWPKEMLWSNYTDALKAADFGRYAINTITIVAGCLIGTLLTSSMAAYAFSRIKWKGQGFCFALVLSTMMLPGSVTLIPQFMIWRNFHMIDTYWPLILPSFFGGGAFNIFLLRQFFLGIPKDLDEAARIDGAGPLQIFFRIIMPISVPIFITAGLMIFMNQWNSYMWPLLVARSKEIRTIQIAISAFSGERAIQWTYIFAASLVSAGIPICLFLPFQKYFVEGITAGSVKG